MPKLKALTRLCACAGLSEPSQLTYAISKYASEKVVCCKKLPYITDELSIEAIGAV